MKRQHLPLYEVISDLMPGRLQVVALKPQPADQSARVTIAIFAALLMYATSPVSA